MLNRANVLLLDEFRMISKDTIDTILRKFLTQRRRPRYAQLSKEERRRERDKEKNMTIYLSSAYWVDHWSYRKCEDTCRFMLDDKKRQFVCGLPYQLSLAEGLLDEDTVYDEMEEADFSELKFQMEYEALWYGNANGTFFDYNSISKNRRIKYPMLPDKIIAKLGGNVPMRIPPKQNGEKRILSADIALMSSKKNNNDATAVFINQLLPTKAGRYTSNIVYADAYEGLRTDDQALIIRKLFDEYECDYIVLDCAGLGLGVYDALARDALFTIGAANDRGTVNRAVVVSKSADEDGNTTVTLDREVTITTAQFWNIHGLANTADEQIGSKSGYIGTDGKAIAYYRGLEMYANMFFYVLGVYREQTTNHVWIAHSIEEADKYDALDKSVHMDTGLQLATGASGAAANGYVKTLGIAKGLAAAPICTEIGGDSTRPVGDYLWMPANTAGNTILLAGGSANDGLYCGPFYGYWSGSSGDSWWDFCARPVLKNP